MEPQVINNGAEKIDNQLCREFSISISNFFRYQEKLKGGATYPTSYDLNYEQDLHKGRVESKM